MHNQSSCQALRRVIGPSARSSTPHRCRVRVNSLCRWETEASKSPQATVSRDLQSVGAVKARDAAGELRYVIGNGHISGDDPEGVLGRLLSEYAESINVSGSLVVVKTPPGAAHVVAAAIDAVGLAGTIGTVAGDDTMLIIADEATTGAAVARDLERMGDRG